MSEAESEIPRDIMNEIMMLQRLLAEGEPVKQAETNAFTVKDRISTKMRRGRGKYSEYEGIIGCQCIKRKYRFCSVVKNIADGKITPALLESKSAKEIKMGKTLLSQDELIFGRNQNFLHSGEKIINPTSSKEDELHSTKALSPLGSPHLPKKKKGTEFSSYTT